MYVYILKTKIETESNVRIGKKNCTAYLLGFVALQF